MENNNTDNMENNNIDNMENNNIDNMENADNAENNKTADSSENSAQSEYYNTTPQYVYNAKPVDPEVEKAKQEAAAKEFGDIGIISLIYAVVFTVCLYDNFSGITSPVWAAATAYCIYYVAKKFNGAWNKINVFMNVVIVLLGFSNFVTDNMEIVFYNYLAIVTLIAVNIVYIFYNTNKVNVTGHILLILQAVFGSIGEMDAPFKQATAYAKMRKQKKNDKLIYIVIGVAITIPILIVVISLLASADQVFRNIFEELAEALSLQSVIDNSFGIVIMALAGYVLPYIFVKNTKKKNVQVKEGKTAYSEPIVANIVATAISVVYVLFSGIQIFYLFMGNGTLPDGYTYAQYAREGFFQLLFVCVLNVIIVLGCIEFFKDNKYLSVMLTIVSCCTFVMVASSAYRMGMYIGEYGLTSLRVLVLWALAVITFIMGGLLYQIYKKEFNLFRYVTIVVSVCFLVLSFGHMDYFIASYNLNMYQQRGLPVEVNGGMYSYADYDYVMNLSADATPVFVEYWDEVNEYIDKSGKRLEDYDWAYQNYREYGVENNKITIRNFNLSRYIARKVIKK